MAADGARAENANAHGGGVLLETATGIGFGLKRHVISSSSPRERDCAHRWRSGVFAASRRMRSVASWFETAQERLLTMRGNSPQSEERQFPQACPAAQLVARFRHARRAYGDERKRVCYKRSHGSEESGRADGTRPALVQRTPAGRRRSLA